MTTCRPIRAPAQPLPAWIVILLSAGAFGRDGPFFFAGCAAFAFSVPHFTLAIFGGGAHAGCTVAAIRDEECRVHILL